MQLQTLLILTFVSVLVAFPAQANNSIDNQTRIATHVQSLNELTEHRRINRFFKNEQTIKYGLPMGYVNTGKGNVSFVLRDLVATTHLPIIIARVYDSSLSKGGDFGQGWQLSLAETIIPQQDGSLLYVDDSASRWHIVTSQTGYTLAKGEVSDITKIDFLTGQELQISYQSGWTKIFSLIGNRYRLTHIDDAFGNRIALAYTTTHHRLIKITGQNGRFVDISRDEQGRIIAATDDLKRQVSYHYNEKNHLASVSDLGQNQWHYRYNGQGLLKKVRDPEGQIAASFTYGANHKTTKANVRGAKHRYHYGNHNQTTVTDQNNNATTLVQNKDGITTQVTNAQGVVSTIELNSNNQIVKLGHDGLLSAQFTYNSDGKTRQLKRHKEDGQYELLTYDYNEQGQLTGITKGATLVSQTVLNQQGRPLRITANGTTRSYTYSKNGDVLSQTEGDVHRSFGYNSFGLLTSMIENGATASFAYNKTGKMSRITFPNGNSHSYQYDNRGFRIKTTRNDGSAVYYTYDNSGSLAGLQKMTEQGESQQRDIALDGNLTKQFVVDGEHALDITYSDTGNPTTVVYAGKAINYQYDEFNRLINIIEDQDTQLSYQYKAGEDDIRIQLDKRTARVMVPAMQASTALVGMTSLYTRGKGTAWRHVSWNDALGRLMLLNEQGYIAADANFKSSSQRRRLYNAIAINKKHQRDFDKPSSSVFTPVQYLAANCEPNYCGMDAVIINGPNEVAVNEIADFSALAFEYRLLDCEPSYSFYVDGNFAYTNNSGQFSVGFSSAGSHSVEVATVCAYCPYAGV
ncbi:MAG: DUF6531 domain-containing protein, partial [Psychrosphaera sp.]|nr:DUF6531 domain-containing protein [Psychrosphaera sp.]